MYVYADVEEREEREKRREEREKRRERRRKGRGGGVLPPFVFERKRERERVSECVCVYE